MATLKELRAKAEKIPEFCQTELWPRVDKFKEDHKVDTSGLVRQIKTWGPLVAVGMLLLFLFSDSQEGKMKSIAMIIGCGATLLGGAFISKELSAFLQQAGKRFQAQMLLMSEFKVKTVKSLCSDFSFVAKPAFPTEIYNACGLFPSGYDLASSEDHVTGLLEKTQFEIQEIKTMNKETYKDSQGRRQTRYIPIFKGILFLADFNKNFKGHTVVKVDTAEKAIGVLGRSAQRLFSSMSKLKLVELESPEFESHFKVLSTDSVEARYILTPSFMESLVGLRKKYGADVQVSFLNSTIVIAVPHAKDFMEFGFNLDNLTADASKMARELCDILEIVEELDLNNRIWNKNSEQAGA